MRELINVKSFKNVNFYLYIFFINFKIILYFPVFLKSIIILFNLVKLFEFAISYSRFYSFICHRKNQLIKSDQDCAIVCFSWQKFANNS